MSLVVVALAAGVLVGLLLGGGFRDLAGVRLGGLGLLAGGAVGEFAGSRWGAGAVGTALLIGGYVLLIAFAVRNAGTAGMVLVAVGLLANLTVIAVNGGMPVRGLPAGTSFGPRHHGERPGDRLTGLADVVAVGPLGETVSAGDLVLSLGVATVVVVLMQPRRRLTPPRAPSTTP